MPRSRTVWKDGKVLAEYENDKLVYVSPEYQIPKRSSTVACPYVVKDIGEYRSPLDGSLITSRSQHRDHMRAHDVIEVGNERMPAAPEVQTHDLGEAIKRRLEEVKELPEAVYQESIQKQTAEHAEIASLISAG